MDPNPDGGPDRWRSTAGALIAQLVCVRASTQGRDGAEGRDEDPASGMWVEARGAGA